MDGSGFCDPLRIWGLRFSPAVAERLSHSSYVIESDSGIVFWFIDVTLLFCMRKTSLRYVSREQISKELLLEIKFFKRLWSFLALRSSEDLFLKDEIFCYFSIFFAHFHISASGCKA